MRWFPLKHPYVLHLGLLASILTACAHQDEWTGSDRLMEGIAALAEKPPCNVQTRFQLEWHGDGLCSLSADGAERSEIVFALLEGAPLGYHCPPYPLSGRLSLRLQRVGFLQALNACLRDLELEARLDGSSPAVVTIGETPERPAKDGASTPQMKDAILKHMAAVHRPSQDLVAFPFKGTSSSRGLLSSQAIPLEVASASDGNRLYLRGPSEVVERGLRIASLADQPAPKLRVEIYSYVIRPNRDALFTQSKLKDNQNGLSMTWTPPQTNQDLPFSLNFLNSVANNQSLDLKALHAKEKAHFLSRSELVVASGQTFAMHVGKTGYILVPQFENGTPAAETRTISTGNIFEITPLLLPNGSVRLTLSVETSKFSLSAAQITNTNLVGNKNISHRAVTVQVPQSSLVVVGGITRPQTNYISNFALSGLRRVPILNRLFGTYLEDEELEQIMNLIKISHHEEGLVPEKTVLIPLNIPVCDEPAGLANLENLER